MDLDRIRNLRRAEPFVPFKLIMKDGRELAVTRVSALAVSPTGKSLAYAGPTGGIDLLDARLVASVEVDSTLATLRKRPA
jgi:hypothetical protein